MSARDRILDAAAEIMRSEGMARATTKEIARRAQCSEALLYKNFRDKSEIFLAVLSERAPGIGALLEKLPTWVGTGLVTDHLRDAVESAMAFYVDTFPMAAGIFSEGRILQAHRATLDEHGQGPWQFNVVVADYIRSEQKLGRIIAEVDPDATAALLLGASLQRAFFHCLAGGVRERPTRAHAVSIVQALWVGLAPPPPATEGSP